ncbi:NADH/Ubiquinone/plastoquinone (complex I) [Thioalkalivibrio sp. K90mix]|uniref:complex I subunit 5 family protein n=1 Tax=Thioalkalivibrio sp. (strain K90mix) TaxID=396595 RepID=UPI000195A7A6|nr:proton-conducting transporter membrane subunit [Thioalkalivibrio sp. K90mix]ADC71516.1 NADH/Ubiquinone/plastoquinone (complex I) [Thioalkalivibrio sp. K90mix]
MSETPAAMLPLAISGLVALSLALAILATIWPRQAHRIGGYGAVLMAAAVVTLSALFLAAGPEPENAATRVALGGWEAPLGVMLHLDGLSMTLLVLTGVVGLATSLYSLGYVHDPIERRQFWPLWLWLWAGLNMLLLSGDAFNLYISLEVVSLSAVALVAFTGTAAAVSGAMRYLLINILGSLSFLMGVVLLFGEHGVLDLVLLEARTEIGPTERMAAVLMTAGLMLKAALFPLHVWLAPAHGSAPAPVSAVLSGLVVTGSFYLILRLWMGPFAPLATPAFGILVGLLGVAALIWGSAQALRSGRLKSIVAYSTVAQFGYLLIAFPLMLVDSGAWKVVVFFAVVHALAKASVFLAAGTLQHAAGHDRLADMGAVLRARGRTVFALGLAGVSLMGLPFTGGFIAKYLLLEAGLSTILAGSLIGVLWVIAIAGGGLLAAGYVLRMVAPAFHRGPQNPGEAVSPWMDWVPLGLAVVAAAAGFAGTLTLHTLTLTPGAP